MNKHIKKLIEYDVAYDLGKPLISDEGYDAFKNEIKSKYPKDSYFNEVGASVPKIGNEVELPYIMGSLTKENVDTVDKWVKGKGYIAASEKIDGVSIMCKWENGIPVSLFLRGNGIIGHDISSKAKYFIPNISEKDTVIFRGDAFLQNFSDLGYSNGRNSAAGILMRKDDDPDLLKHLIPYFYEIIESPYIPSEEYERFLYISSLGLKIPDIKLISTGEISNIKYILVDFISNSKKNKPYDVDGIVIAKNDSTRENVLYPKNKTAFKIKGEEINVNVNNITWNVSRFGRLKPIINIDPVKLGGVTISNVTGFNASYVYDNNIGVGTTLSITRAGDIIPYITDIIKSTTAVFPKKCPSCGGKLKLIGDDITCISVYCSGSELKQAAYFLKTIGLKGYSEVSLDKMGIKSLIDVIDFDKIGRISRWSIYTRYTRALSNTLKNIHAYKLLAGLGIPNIGIKVAFDICNKLQINSNTDFIKLFNKDIINKIKLTPVVLKSLTDNIEKYADFYGKLCQNTDLIIIPYDSEKTKTLSGLKFVITGTLSVPRSSAVKYIEDNGGKVSSTVTKDTESLIVPDYISNTEKESTKFRKAISLNIPIINWNDFRRKYNL